MEAPGPAVEKRSGCSLWEPEGALEKFVSLFLKGWGESNMAQMVIE